MSEQEMQSVEAINECLDELEDLTSELTKGIRGMQITAFIVMLVGLGYLASQLLV